MSMLLDSLNDKQKEAVLHGDGPLLLLAGAGSGKTRVITHRIAYLIAERGVNPYQILALTFTNKAAGEMRERVDRLVSQGAESIWVSTFHSTCVRILRRYIDRLGYDRSFTIYDADDQKTLMKGILKDFNLDPKKFKERTFLNIISHAKDDLVSPDDYAKDNEKDFRQKHYIDAYYEYQKRLKDNNALDFDDLIYLTVQLFREEDDVLEYYQNRFRYILVDEYQDTNTAQFKLLELLAGKYRNLCVVGDDDQSIYKFRGANIYNILNFEKVFPDAVTIRLEQNYRSTKNILEAASGVIKNNVGRKEKTLWTEAGEGEPIIYARFDTDLDEAAGVAGDIRKRIRDEGASYSDFAILYRTNAQSRSFEEKLVYEGIPYRIIGAVNFYARMEIKDLMCYLKTICNGQDDVSVRRIINVPRRGVGDTSIGKIAAYATENNLSFYDALQQADSISGISRSLKGIQSFVDLIEGFRAKLVRDPETGAKCCQDDYSLEEMLRDIIDQTDYVRDLEAEETPQADARIENIESLINKVTQYEEDTPSPSLDGLLEDISLVADIDTLDMDADQVLLMTLHGAKGLEFPYVYIVGMEEGVFPGGAAAFGDDEDELEEERRLCYVGITRAKKTLTLTGASQRMRNGQTEFNRPSRFIGEIPRYLIKQTVGERQGQKRQSISFDDLPDFLKQAGAKSARRTPSAKRKSNVFANNPYISKGFGGSSSTGTSGTSVNYSVGDTVTHIKFGIGTVTDMEDKGNEYIVTVEFEDFGTRKLMSSFAKLNKV